MRPNAPQRPSVSIEASTASRVAAGHPWIYRESISEVRGAPKTGDAVTLSARGSREVLGVGLFDASSQIAVRVYAQHDANVDKVIIEQIDRAIAFRRRIFDDTTTAMRLCHGEGDRVPGVVLDRYGEVAILRLDGDAIATRFENPALARALFGKLTPIGVRSLGLRSAASHEGDSPDDKRVRDLEGEPVPRRVEVLENGMTLEVDLWHGQKTGAFLDQRENRARVRRWARGARKVLNLFSYTGGFSLAAALGGAERVTSVDSAAQAHASAQRSFRKNGLDPARHDFVTADAFAYLDSAAQKGERFDLVICDPPSFAPSERAKKRALSAYEKLHRACARVLAPGGMLAAASCSSHVTMEDFMSTLDDRALGRSDLVVRGAFGPPEDHPSLAAFPEGRYLKLVLLA
ncbi:MAG: class I SAM-dependent rRNA methyltransferase [Polyangiaceae bacterium]